MSDANPQQEPSMEEILASIRRIISEDDDPSAEPKDAPAEEASDDVLELTEIAEEPHEEAAAPEPEPEPEREPEPEPAPEEEPVEEDLSIDEVLDDLPQEDELELREAEEVPAAAAPEPSPAPPPAPVDGGLIAAETATAATGMLSGLVAAVDRAHGGSALGDGNRTIEDLVKEVMRPMVKDWLDENLPALTERLVRREIERLARHAEDD